METGQRRDGDKDDNSLLAVANFDLIKTQSQHASSRTDALDRFPSCSSEVNMYVGRAARLPSSLSLLRALHPGAPLQFRAEEILDCLSAQPGGKGGLLPRGTIV